MIPIAVYSHFSAIRSRLKGLGPASALGSELLQPTTFIVKLLLYVVLVLCTTSSFNYFPVLAPIFSKRIFDKINLAVGTKGILVIVPFPLRTSAQVPSTFPLSLL